MHAKPPRPISLAKYQKVKSVPIGTPIITTADDLLRAFRNTPFHAESFPKGTIGLVFYPLPRGNFVGFSNICVSEPGVDCWFEPKAGGRCICDETGSVIPPFEVLPCQLLAGSCSGTCTERGKRCQRRFTFIGPIAARQELTTYLDPLPKLSSSVLDALSSRWLTNIAVLFGCVCIDRHPTIIAVPRQPIR